MIGNVTLPLWMFIVALALTLVCIGMGLYLTITGKTLTECFWTILSKCPRLRRKAMEASE